MNKNNDYPRPQPESLVKRFLDGSRPSDELPPSNQTDEYEQARIRALKCPVRAAEWNPDDAADFSITKAYSGIYALVSIVLCIKTENYFGWRIETLMVGRISAQPVPLALLSNRQKLAMTAEVERVLAHDKFYRRNWQKKTTKASKVIEVGLSDADYLVMQQEIEKEL